MLDGRHLLDPQADRACRAPCRPGTRSGTSAAGPDRLPRDDDEAVVEIASWSMAMRVEALADLEGDGLACSSTVRQPLPCARPGSGPAQDERAVRVVLELVLGVDPAADPDVARRPGGQRRSASATGMTGVAASRRPTR